LWINSTVTVNGNAYHFTDDMKIFSAITTTKRLWWIAVRH